MKDKRANAKIPIDKGRIYMNREWIHSDYLEYWLKLFCSDGSLLNVCSGSSQIGDVLADIDPETNRTTHADLFKILDYFKPNSFDYVYCDPPFNIYTSGDNRFRWQYELFSLCRIALITRRPKVNVNMPSRKHQYVICEDSRPSLSLLRIDYK